MNINKIISIFAVILVVSASVAAATTVMEKDQEPDGNPALLIYAPTFISMAEAAPAASAVSLGMVGGVAILVVGAFALGFVIGEKYGYDQAADHYEKIIAQMELESKQIAKFSDAQFTNTRVSDADAFTTNALNNYAQVWKYTEEHWIRQAEMAAFGLWQSGKTYSSSDVLGGSGIYLGNAIMLANSTVQMNILMNIINEHSKDWYSEEPDSNGNRLIDTYGSDMHLTFGFSNGYDVSSNTGNLKGQFMSATDGSTGSVYLATRILDSTDYISGEGQVNYVPGYVYVMGEKAVLKGEDGVSHTLNHGKNNVSSLESGIYDVSGSVILSDSLSKAIGRYDSLNIHSGLLMENDDGLHYAYYKDGTVFVDGRPSNYVKYHASADNIRSVDEAHLLAPVDLTSIMASYEELLKQMNICTINANNSAQALWGIYDAVNEKNAWATTLSFINNYDNSVLSSQMKSAMTVSAMQQLADYYQGNKTSFDNLTYTFADTESENVPLVRGTIYSEKGDALWTDVMFTPFFQKENVSLERGVRTTVDQNATAMVWSAGSTFNEWLNRNNVSEDGKSIVVTQNGTMISLQKGDYFVPQELGQLSKDGISHADSLELEVKMMKFIDGEEMVNPDPTPTITHHDDESTGFWITVIVWAAGILLAVYGLYSGRPGFVAMGIAVVAGYYVIDYIQGKIDSSPLGWFGGLL